MEKDIEYIACCGCYCKTCKAYQSYNCRGCKLGYNNNERDINKTKCKIKLCCFKVKRLKTCADCDDFDQCIIISNRFKPGTRDNKKCLESLFYIKNQGYESYLNMANKWKNHFGKFK